MAEGFIQVPVDGAGKQLKTWILPDGKHAEAVVLVDPEGNLESAPESPQSSALETVDLAAAASADLDAALITSGKLAKLAGVTVGGSVAARWDIFAVSGGTTRLDTVFTGHGMLSATWTPPHRNFTVLLGTGSSRFRVRVTNLDTTETTDFVATVYFDEE